jgi:hypothetical protein
MINFSTGISNVWYNSFLEKYQSRKDTENTQEVDSVVQTEFKKSVSSKDPDDYTKLKNSHRRKIFNSLDSAE